MAGESAAGQERRTEGGREGGGKGVKGHARARDRFKNTGFRVAISWPTLSSGEEDETADGEGGEGRSDVPSRPHNCSAVQRKGRGGGGEAARREK